jgi:hypothetical protein
MSRQDPNDTWDHNKTTGRSRLETERTTRTVLAVVENFWKAQKGIRYYSIYGAAAGVPVKRRTLILSQMTVNVSSKIE